MKSGSLKSDLLLLLILIFLLFLLFFIENKTGLINHIRNEIFLKLTYFSKLQKSVVLAFNILKEGESSRSGLSDIATSESELFKVLIIYYRNKLRQLLELNNLTFKKRIKISRFLEVRRSVVGSEYVLEISNVAVGSVVIDPVLKRIIGIVKQVGENYCIVSTPENKDFSLLVDIKTDSGKSLSAVLRGDGKQSFVDIFEDVSFNNGKVFLSHSHRSYNILSQLDCTLIGEITPIPIERDGYRSYVVQIYLPTSEYLLVVGDD